MVTLALIAFAFLMVVVILFCGYMACSDKCLFHRLCAMNNANACFACLCEVLATIFRGFSEN